MEHLPNCVNELALANTKLRFELSMCEALYAKAKQQVDALIVERNKLRLAVARIADEINRTD
jgi:hypothetical protein